MSATVSHHIPSLALTGDISSLPSVSAASPVRSGILLVEPDPAILTLEALLLNRSDYCVTTASNHLQLFTLRHTDSPAVAVLSDSLGAAALRAAAEAVRRQWPLARILIVGRAAMVLDDNLYEHEMPHFSDPEELLIALREFTINPSSSSFPSHYSRTGSR